MRFFGVTVAAACLLGSAAASSPLQAQQSADTLAIEAAAMGSIDLSRWASTGRRLVFDDRVDGRPRPEAAAKALRERFKLTAATAAESGRCSQGLTCSGVPAGAVIIDLSTPVIQGDSATAVVRVIWSSTKSDGTIGTGGNLHQLQLVRRQGTWVFVSGKVTAVG